MDSNRMVQAEWQEVWTLGRQWGCTQTQGNSRDSEESCREHTLRSIPSLCPGRQLPEEISTPATAQNSWKIMLIWLAHSIDARSCIALDRKLSFWLLAISLWPHHKQYNDSSIFFFVCFAIYMYKYTTTRSSVSTVHQDFNVTILRLHTMYNNTLNAIIWRDHSYLHTALATGHSENR